MGAVLWTLWGKRRWLAMGICPDIGFAGYVLDGGHSPYEGKLGLACDSLLSARVVDATFEVRVASRTLHPDLFWALCGGGGGHFGIVTKFGIRTASSRPFDRSVGFRFRWPHARAGEVLSKWQKWGQVNGRVWFRMEVFQDKSSGLLGHGACYDVDSTAMCIEMLETSSFFKVAGWKTLFLQRLKKAVALAGFLGPDGGWSSYVPSHVSNSLLGKRYLDRGQGNQRTHVSSFMKLKVGKRTTSASFWQKYANLCSSPGRPSISWAVCQLNLFNRAVSLKRNNAFPFHSADIIMQYIVSGGSVGDRNFTYWRMKIFLQAFTVGGYVNYQEHQIRKETYPKYYWAESLSKLQKVAGKYNGGRVFAHPQPTPDC